MAASPETRAKDGAKKRLKVLKQTYPRQIKCWWLPGAVFMEDTLDLIGFVNGHPFVMEWKRYDGKGEVTKRQLLTLRECNDAGAYTMVVDNPEKEDHFFRWLQSKCIA